MNFIPTAHPLPEGVAVDANHVYWANCAGCVTGTTIGRANLDGTGVDQNFITELGSAFGVAVDSPVPTDAATEVIVEGKTKSNKTRKEFVVQVTNAGTSSFTVSPDDVAALVAVNGGAFGTVAAQDDGSATLSPGAETRFRFEWAYSGLRRGDAVTYEACVNLSTDLTSDNNCDTASATAK